LLDKHTLGGKQTKLIDWMWIGWGIKHIPHARNVEHQDRTLGELQQHLTEPWGLLSGEVKYLAACRKHGVLDKTILLQYGMIEAEPAYPHTNVAIDLLRSTIDTAFVPNTDILGLMGNMQTPLLQFPHMYYFTSTMWNLDSRQISERDTLLAVASLLYPEHRDLVADCYAGLKSSDADQIEDMANQLDPLIQQDGLGRLGVFGRKLFPDGRIVAQSLVYQLKLRSSTQRLMQVSDDTAQRACIAAIRDCLDASLAWGQANGWPALWGKRKPALEALASDPRFAQLPVRLASCLKEVPTAEGAFNQMVAEQSQKYDSTIVEERGARWLRQEVIGLEKAIT
jgi:hypothetical protein